MRFPRVLPASLDLFGRNRRRATGQEALPAFLFERASRVHHCVERRAGVDIEESARPRLVAGNQPPFRFRRRENAALSGSAVPVLTLTSAPYNSITVAGGSSPDWDLSLCAHGEGDSEDTARRHLQQHEMSVAGGVVALMGPDAYGDAQSGAHLLVDAPSRAGVVISAPNSYVVVQDLTGPVHVAATHARARVINATGQVNVTAGCIDLLATSGSMILSAEIEINLWLAAIQFEGTLTAWAQGAVRLRLPANFATPISACLRADAAFVCAPAFAARITETRQGSLRIFTYAGAEGSRPPIHLRSVGAAIAIDLV